MNLYEVIDMIKEKESLEHTIESMGRLHPTIQISLEGSPNRHTFCPELDEEIMEIVVLKAKARLDQLKVAIRQAEDVLRRVKY